MFGFVATVIQKTRWLLPLAVWLASLPSAAAVPRERMAEQRMAEPPWKTLRVIGQGTAALMPMHAKNAVTFRTHHAAMDLGLERDGDGVLWLRSIRKDLMGAVQGAKRLYRNPLAKERDIPAAILAKLREHRSLLSADGGGEWLDNPRVVKMATRGEVVDVISDNGWTWVVANFGDAISDEVPAGARVKARHQFGAMSAAGLKKTLRAIPKKEQEEMNRLLAGAAVGGWLGAIANHMTRGIGRRGLTGAARSARPACTAWWA